jgi:hypothetical protein
MKNPALLLLSSLLVPVVAIHPLDSFGLIDWVTAKEGGYFNAKQELRLENPYDPTSRVTLVAKTPIKEGEILSTIPWNLIITAADDDVDEISGELNCDTIRQLAAEMALGEGSEYGPYIQYLNSLGPNQIPSSWSMDGKELFVDILGGEEQELPPGSAVSLLDDDWHDMCRGGVDGDVAAALVFQRALDDTFMIPIFDWYTHRNGDYYNVKSELKPGLHFQIVARRPIEAGETIHNSYDLCDDCNDDAVESGYGTPGTRPIPSLLSSFLYCVVSIVQ